MDMLVVVKFHTNIANRWHFMIQRKIIANILYSLSYFDMFGGGAFFSGHGVYTRLAILAWFNNLFNSPTLVTSSL